MLGDLLGRQEQKSVIGEERPVRRTANREEFVGLRNQLLFQGDACEMGKFRRWGLNHGQNQVMTARKCLFVGYFALPPVNIGRNQGRDVSIDRKMPRRIDACQDRQYHAKSHS
ncbi:MAG TPA: hypothetical protein VHA37_06625 [Candidatus Saccharimonadales bacterium]|nr:hypothetical protein [Candidatus Saccharimonadales bacterium]